MTLPQFNAHANAIKAVAAYMADEKAEHSYKDRKIIALQEALSDARTTLRLTRNAMRWHRERWLIVGVLIGMVVGVIVGASL